MKGTIAPVSRPNPFLYTRGIKTKGTLAVVRVAAAYMRTMRRKAERHFTKDQLMTQQKEAALTVMGPHTFRWLERRK